jgi:cell division protein FtsZ
MRGMGKAMMGTGEASGEKRAIAAAEAAIANPLLDDVSMKGARGLLISITGGNDLTLYEVDEAATRIREEVDEQANIILGATFDASLEGIIRVSVVATGIDSIVGTNQSDVAATEKRIAEVAERLRAEARQRAQQALSTHRPIIEPLPIRASAPVAQERVEQRVDQAKIEASAAIVMRNEVSIEPVVARPVEPVVPINLSVEAEPEAAYFIPPQADRVVRPTRMPRVEELPLPAQNQMRARRGEGASETPDQKRMTLLQRLASVGLGRREEPPAAAPQPQRPAARPAAPSSVHAEYAKRPSQQAARTAQQASLDMHGRPAAPARTIDDDQLEIPAFLRRQAN